MAKTKTARILEEILAELDKHIGFCDAARVQARGEERLYISTEKAVWLQAKQIVSNKLEVLK